MPAYGTMTERMGVSEVEAAYVLGIGDLRDAAKVLEEIPSLPGAPKRYSVAILRRFADGPTASLDVPLDHKAKLKYSEVAILSVALLLCIALYGSIIYIQPTSWLAQNIDNMIWTCVIFGWGVLGSIFVSDRRFRAPSRDQLVGGLSLATICIFGGYALWLVFGNLPKYHSLVDQYESICLERSKAKTEDQKPLEDRARGYLKEAVAFRSLPSRVNLAWPCAELR
jgi:hypothetical protein